MRKIYFPSQPKKHFLWDVFTSAQTSELTLELSFGSYPEMVDGWRKVWVKKLYIAGGDNK